jgi:2-amino-4-hydroxy-6-hydroxymethyldihydropteridine diphosphokinase
VDAYLAFGSNLGDREANLRAGVQGLARRGLRPDLLSSIWETEPVDSPEPLWFLNLVARVRTSLPPLALLDLLLEIEREVGRVRTVRNAPRLLDLDLLLWGDTVLETDRLVLPHPRMWTRRFVLEPLAEIAPDATDPRTGRAVAEALRVLADPSVVRKAGVLASPLGVPL